MSIYSGFATRAQQQQYDTLIQDLIYVMTKRIIKFYQQEQADEEKFITIISNIHSQLFQMQKNKYLEPNMSEALQQLLQYLKKQHKNILPLAKPTNMLPKPSLLNPENIKNRDSLSISGLRQQGSIGKIMHQFKIRTQKKDSHLLNFPAQSQSQQKPKQRQIEENTNRPATQGKARKSYSSSLPPNKDVSEVLKNLVTNRKNYLRGYRRRNQIGSRTFALRQKMKQKQQISQF